jgi:hypothetical protein
MTLANYATYLGVMAILLGLIAGLDIVFPDRIKLGFGSIIRRLLLACGNPFGIGGYIFVLSSSAILTIYVALLTGVLNTLIEKSELLYLPLKSAGPLITALVLKVLLWDYFMAIKSYAIIQLTRKEHARQLDTGKTPGPVTFVLIIVGLSDVLLSTAITQSFMSTFEMSSLEKMVGAENLQNATPKSFSNFFDEISFSLKFSLERAFYILNGTFIYYLGALLSKVASTDYGIINWRSIENRPFTILYITLLAVSAVVLSSVFLAFRF